MAAAMARIPKIPDPPDTKTDEQPAVVPVPPDLTIPTVPPDQSPPTAVSPSPHSKKNMHFTVGKEGDAKTPFEKWLQKQIIEKVGEDGSKGKLFLDTLRSNIPAMMLCCIPLFAFVLKILYFRQKRYYVEHLVYALHIHTFLYVAVIITSLAVMGANRTLPALAGWIIALLSIAGFVQIFLSIRRVYRQGWFMT